MSVSHITWRHFKLIQQSSRPKLQIGFAFVPTLLSWSDIANNKAGEFQEIVMRVVREKKGGEKR